MTLSACIRWGSHRQLFIQMEKQVIASVVRLKSGSDHHTTDVATEIHSHWVESVILTSTPCSTNEFNNICSGQILDALC